MKKFVIKASAMLALFLFAFGGFSQNFIAKSAYAGGDKKKETKIAKAEIGKDGNYSFKEGKFVDLDPLVVPIVGNNGVSQLISIAVTLEVDSGMAEKVDTYSPRITDAFIQDMYGALSREAAMENGIVKVKMIKYRLKKVLKRVLGEDMQANILLQGLQQRRV